VTSSRMWTTAGMRARRRLTSLRFRMRRSWSLAASLSSAWRPLPPLRFARYASVAR
jgi:hypothetical protein